MLYPRLFYCDMSMAGPDNGQKFLLKLLAPHARVLRLVMHFNRFVTEAVVLVMTAQCCKLLHNPCMEEPMQTLALAWLRLCG